jgi:hypothetical protein
LADANQTSDTMGNPERHSETSSDAVVHPRDEGWTITPRAVTTIATIITILYSLHAPVRYVLGIASSVESLTGRVAALEAIAAHEAERASELERLQHGADANESSRPR